MDLSDRLRDARQDAGFASAREAADALGVPPATYAAHENGTRGVKSDAVKRYARRFGVSVQWLMFGGTSEPSPFIERADERFHAGKAGLVPVYDVTASAGFGSLVNYEEQTHSLAFPPDYLKKLTAGSSKDLVIISTKGDSMEPTLLDDDIVLVDTSKTHMGFEGMFVIRHNDTLLVKRVGMSAKSGHAMLISDNKAYPPLEVALEDTQVVGKVLWYGRKV